jgi:hypothetical protein
VPGSVEESTLRSLVRFVPFACAFAWRHLTIGTLVRTRRRWMRWRGRTWYL